jgi:hypothetical protein
MGGLAAGMWCQAADAWYARDRSAAPAAGPGSGRAMSSGGGAGGLRRPASACRGGRVARTPRSPLSPVLANAPFDQFDKVIDATTKWLVKAPVWVMTGYARG